MDNQFVAHPSVWLRVSKVQFGFGHIEVVAEYTRNLFEQAMDLVLRVGDAPVHYVRISIVISLVLSFIQHT